MQNDFNAPAPGRFCRLQILAFLVLNLLGSCVHVPPVRTPAQAVSATQPDQQTAAQPVTKTATVAPV